MRTSLTEVHYLEPWLLDQGETVDQLMIEAKVLVDPELKEKAKWQAEAYEMIYLHGRDKLKEEIRKIEHQLFHLPKHRTFQERIKSIFKV